jgi:hypothetical protein
LNLVPKPAAKIIAFEGFMVNSSWFIVIYFDSLNYLSVGLKCSTTNVISPQMYLL